MKKSMLASVGVLLAFAAGAASFRLNTPTSVATPNGSTVNYKYTYETDTPDATTVKVTGLPAGLKYVQDKAAKAVYVSGTTSQKDKIYWTTFSGKDGNGYTHSTVVTYTIGEPAYPEVDKIGLNGRIVEVGTEAGTYVCYTLKDLLYGGMTSIGDIKSFSVTGLPTGLVFTKNANDLGQSTFAGYLTKPGKFAPKLSVVTHWGEKRTATQICIVKDAGCANVQVGYAKGSYEWMGTAGKSAICAVGSGKLSLTAKPAKDYVFAGWYVDADREEILRQGASAADYRKPSITYPLVEDPELGVPTRIYAAFVAKATDLGHLGISFSSVGIKGDTWTVRSSPMIKDCYAFAGINVSSYSLPTVTVKGLPPGCTYDKSTGALIFKSAPQKPGTYVVTVTAKNVSGASVAKTLTVVVPNLRSDLLLLDNPEEFYEGVFTARVGGSHEEPTFGDQYYLAEGCTVTASGLPPGVRFVYDAEEGYCAFNGQPTKAGTYTVMLTIKKGKTTEKASLTVRILPVDPMAVGTYYGVLYDLEAYAYKGSFQVSVPASGKASSKFVYLGKSFSESTTPCSQSDEKLFFHGDTQALKKGWFYECLIKTQEGLIDGDESLFSIDDEALTKMPQASLIMRGWINRCEKEPACKAVAEKLAKLGQLKAYAGNTTCERDIQGIGRVSPKPASNVTLTVKPNGLVTVAGKIEGLSVSKTTCLKFEPNLRVEDFVFVNGKGVYFVIPLHANRPADQTVVDGFYVIY